MNVRITYANRIGISTGGEAEVNSSVAIRCPGCSEPLREVLEYVTEQREYRFSVVFNEYLERSDPVDDTARLDYVACAYCLEPLPEPVVQQLFGLCDAFSISP